MLGHVQVVRIVLVQVISGKFKLYQDTSD